jgi:hypothetical protein
VNLLKSELFGVVACLKTSVAEFNHPLDQSSQARCQFLLSPLVVNERWEQRFVCPLRSNMHINQEPPLGRTPPRTLEGGIDIFLSTAVTT